MFWGTKASRCRDCRALVQHLSTRQSLEHKAKAMAYLDPLEMPPVLSPEAPCEDPFQFKS